MFLHTAIQTRHFYDLYCVWRRFRGRSGVFVLFVRILLMLILLLHKFSDNTFFIGNRIKPSFIPIYEDSRTPAAKILKKIRVLLLQVSWCTPYRGFQKCCVKVVRPCPHAYRGASPPCPPYRTRKKAL